MGRAGRWFRGFLLGKRTADGGAAEAHAKEKKKWGFLKTFREKERAQQPRDCSLAAAEDRKGSYREMRPTAVVDGDEQNKRAIAVAAATAAVAEAAVAAAQAAAAVVRLTSSGRSVGLAAEAELKKEECAAVKIQAAFRGYLARRALRALKGLVKLQALVRGNIVRKQAAETLRCMQALVRVQARARACRALRSEPSRSSRSSRSNHGPATPEKYEAGIRLNVSKTDSSGSLKRNSSKQVGGMDADNKERDHSANWNWLDQWMEERYWDCREASKVMDDEKSAKILEVDTGKPQFNPKQKSSHSHLQTSCCNMNSDQSARSLAAVPDSASKDLSSTTQISVPSPSTVNRHQSMSPLLRFPAEDFRESPRFYSATSRPGSSRRGPFTPAKSERACSLFSGYSDYPNYMANTESSRAKVRSLSAPRQRPAYEKSSSVRRLSAHGLGGGQESAASGWRPSTSHSHFANKAYPSSGRLDRLGCR